MREPRRDPSRILDILHLPEVRPKTDLPPLEVPLQGGHPEVVATEVGLEKQRHETALDVQRSSMNGQGRFLHCLVQGRVGMEGPCEIFGRTAELHGNDNFVQEVAGLGTKNMGAQDAVGFLVRQNLHHPSVAHGPSPGP